MKFTLLALLAILSGLLFLLYQSNKKLSLSLLFICIIVLCLSFDQSNKENQITTAPEILNNHTA